MKIYFQVKLTFDVKSKRLSRGFYTEITIKILKTSVVQI